VATPRTTFTLAVTFVLASAWLLFFEPRLETTDEHAALRNRIVHVHADQVHTMHLRRDAWTAATLERIDAATFKRTEPVPGAVDSPAVAELLSELEFQDHLTALDGHGSDPGHLYDEGLTPPLLTVTLTLVDNRELEFELGKETPTGDGVYLHVRDDPQVQVVAKPLTVQLNRLLDQLADTGSGSGKPGADAAAGDGRRDAPPSPKDDARGGD
jgi:hypothetical protein